jgi:hypothetical protein
MTVHFSLPASWSTLAGSDVSALTCEAATVGEALTWLVARFPVFVERIYLDRQAGGSLAPWSIVCLDHVQVLDPATPYRAITTPCCRSSAR